MLPARGIADTLPRSLTPASRVRMQEEQIEKELQALEPDIEKYYNKLHKPQGANAPNATTEGPLPLMGNRQPNRDSIENSYNTSFNQEAPQPVTMFKSYMNTTAPSFKNGARTEMPLFFDTGKDAKKLDFFGAEDSVLFFPTQIASTMETVNRQRVKFAKPVSPSSSPSTTFSPYSPDQNIDNPLSLTGDDIFGEKRFKTNQSLSNNSTPDCVPSMLSVEPTKTTSSLTQRETGCDECVVIPRYPKLPIIRDILGLNTIIGQGSVSSLSALPADKTSTVVSSIVAALPNLFKCAREYHTTICKRRAQITNILGSGKDMLERGWFEDIILERDVDLDYYLKIKIVEDEETGNTAGGQGENPAELPVPLLTLESLLDRETKETVKRTAQLRQLTLAVKGKHKEQLPEDAVDFKIAQLSTELANLKGVKDSLTEKLGNAKAQLAKERSLYDEMARLVPVEKRMSSQDVDKEKDAQIKELSMKVNALSGALEKKRQILTDLGVFYDEALE